MISRELRDALIAFEIAVRVHVRFGHRNQRGAERVDRVQKAKARLVAVIEQETRR
jgi:hypothetical protein